MSKNVYYRQCVLSRPTETGVMKQMSWIPERFATKSRPVKLRDDDGVWTDGWKVDRVGEIRLEEGELPDYHHEIKNHRKNTGDSQPKG